MKKILLLLAAAAVYCSAGAVELSFWLGNQKITPGQTVQFNDIKVDTYDSWKEVYMSPKIYLSSDAYLENVKVTADCTSGQTIQMCCGGNCTPGVTVTKKNLTISGGSKLDLEFDYINYDMDLDETIPTIVTVFEAVVEDDESIKAQFVLEMNKQSAALSKIELNNGVKAVAGGLTYNAAETAALSIYSITGMTVFNANVSGEGTVKLPRGLYVYSFGGCTGKIYIR